MVVSRMRPASRIDRGGLHGRDLVLAKALAHDLQPARERGIAERAALLARERRADGRGQRLLRVGELALRLGERRRDRPDRLTGALHGQPPSRGDRS